MTKTRSFSIYLLKPAFDATNALKDDTKLEAGIDANGLPEGAVLHVLDNPPYTPWWAGYFGVQKELRQVSKGSIVFLSAAGRWFALSFGHVSHNLKDESYEYDFGLRVTLNSVDPDKLKSTDTLEPSGSKRQRIQLPTASDLTVFDIDTDSNILKSLTGKVKAEHKKTFSHASGASSIRISSAVAADGLIDLCGKLLVLYQDNSFETVFPDIQNISPMRDPVVVDQLNAKLIDAIKAKDDGVSLSIPEIQNYAAGIWGTFSGEGGGLIYDDIYIARYFEYLDAAGFDLNAIDKKMHLDRHRLALTSEDGSSVLDSWPIFKCLVFDTTLVQDGDAYHLSEGNWYAISTDYVTRLTTYLDPLCKDTALPDFTHEDEAAYNTASADVLETRVCLDKTNIAPAGQKQVEPCDIYEVADGKAILHHVKISTLSAQLSHLFNQGTNSVKLLRADAEAMTNLQNLVSAKLAPAASDAMIAPLKADQMKVVFQIVTHKEKEPKSLNLPLFSRISLMRCMKELKVMGIEAEFCFISDQSAKTAGKKKARKPKGGAAE